MFWRSKSLGFTGLYPCPSFCLLSLLHVCSRRCDLSSSYFRLLFSYHCKFPLWNDKPKSLHFSTRHFEARSFFTPPKQKSWKRLAKSVEDKDSNRRLFLGSQIPMEHILEIESCKNDFMLEFFKNLTDCIGEDAIIQLLTEEHHNYTQGTEHFI